jgi:uncharacterized membrane protein
VAQHKWIDQSQPQTLQSAVILAYINAAFGVLFFFAFGAGLSLLLLVLGGAASGVANERRWAYRLAVVAAGLYVVVQVTAFFVIHGFSGLLNLIFAVVLLALLLHPQSREYQRIWFR